MTSYFKGNIPNIITVSVVILGALVLSSIINPIFDTTVKTLTKTVYIQPKEGLTNKNNKAGKKKYTPAKKRKVIGGKRKKENNRKGKKNKKEGLAKMVQPTFATSGLATSAASFCDVYKNNPSELEKKCNTFNKSACGSSSCCVWLNGEKCVAGDGNGPTFHTSSSGKPINVDYN